MVGFGLLSIRGERMRDIISCAIVCLMLCVLLASCMGLADWSYEINDHYMIVRPHAGSRTLEYSPSGNDIGGSETVVGGIIIRFQYNKRFIGVYNGGYYVVDMDTGERYGVFFTEEQYVEQCELLNVGVLGDWIETADLS